MRVYYISNLKYHEQLSKVRVEFRCWLGDHLDETAQNIVHEWIYTGQHIPRPEQPRVHINLWQFSSNPQDDQEAVITNFSFVPIDEDYQIVKDLIIQFSDSNVVLSWAPIPDATFYHIYGSCNPHTDWSKILTTYVNSAVLTIFDTKYFYRVTWE